MTNRKLNTILNSEKNRLKEKLHQLEPDAFYQYSTWMHDDGGVDLVDFVDADKCSDDISSLLWMIQEVHEARLELQELYKLTESAKKMKIALSELIAI